MSRSPLRLMSQRISKPPPRDEEPRPGGGVIKATKQEFTQSVEIHRQHRYQQVLRINPFWCLLGADPGFGQGGLAEFGPQGGWAQNLLKIGGFPSKLPENCMILKKYWGQGGEAGPPGPLDPLLVRKSQSEKEPRMQKRGNKTWIHTEWRGPQVPAVSCILRHSPKDSPGQDRNPDKVQRSGGTRTRKWNKNPCRVEGSSGSTASPISHRFVQDAMPWRDTECRSTLPSHNLYTYDNNKAKIFSDNLLWKFQVTKTETLQQQWFPSVRIFPGFVPWDCSGLEFECWPGLKHLA